MISMYQCSRDVQVGWHIFAKPTKGSPANENMGLYREDGLSIFKNMSGPEIERTKKELVKVFKNNGLPITVKTNLKTADFLNIHFDLVKEIYQPYNKTQ